MKTLINKFLILGLVTIILGSCVKQEFDEPPKQTIPEGTYLTVGQLRQMIVDSVQNVTAATQYRFTEEYSVIAVVTMDEDRSGNLYKSVYIADTTGAINMQLLYSGSLYEGDSIRISMKGLLLKDYNGAFQIDSVDIEKNVVKLGTGVETTPVTVTLADLQTGAYEAQLIKLEDVQFPLSEIGMTYAEFEVNTNRTLEDCEGRTVIVRSSGWSSFYDDTLPEGKGSVVAVASVYGSDLQIYLRSVEEVDLTGERCPGTGLGDIYLTKDYSDSDVFSGGWTEQRVTGSVGWSIYAGSNPAAQISNYNGSGNDACETWLISPSIDMSGGTAPILNFRNASGYFGDDMEVYVSTNYDGSSAPGSATWTQLTYNIAPEDPFWSWTDGGPVDLTPYISANTYIAFVYKGTDSNGKTWEIDDISVQEQ